MKMKYVTKIVALLLISPILLMGAKCDRENYHGPGSGPALDPLFEEEPNKIKGGNSRSCEAAKAAINDPILDPPIEHRRVRELCD